ncbi:MAG: hypothetical protein MUO85_04755 [candidate division Zixibacteria bacterium]|nr:hypothetical protein [candidate division Zixibacteria bacterium]
MKKRILVLLVVVLALTFVAQIFATAPVNARDGYVCYPVYDRYGHVAYNICCIYINHVLKCKKVPVSLPSSE